MVALNKTYQKTLTPDRSAKDSGYRYYSPEISRWLNRDPIGERGSEHLYQFVRNLPTTLVDGFGDAPFPVRGNSDILWALNMNHRPIGHPELGGAYGRTPIPTLKDAAPAEKILKVSACCAKVERAAASDMMIWIYVPDASAVGTYVTARGRSEVRAHEIKRGRAYLDGYEACYGPVSGTGSAVLKCGKVCRKRGWLNAKAALSNYIAEQRIEAWSQFYNYELRAQAEIGRENSYWGEITVGGVTLFDHFTRYFSYTAPAPFDDSRVTCPASDM
jgi:RHS repeat-associated protein